MKNPGEVLKLALFGHPIAHSRSPAIHRAFAAQAGIDIDYALIDCPAGALSERFAEFSTAGGAGCNLTVPVKAEGLALADSAAEAARLAGAANTLVRRGSGWHADNTDGAGLVADFRRLGIGVSGRRVLIAGAGGAVAGILAGLLAEHPAAVYVANRTPARAAALIERFGAAGLAGGGYGQAAAAAPFDLVIQATSLGHGGAVPPLEPDWLAPDAVAYDLNYGPAHAAFAAWCAKRGIPCHDGLGMLVEQAALSFGLWTGFVADTAPVLEALSADDS